MLKLDRRQLLKLAGVASLATVVGGCNSPDHAGVPSMVPAWDSVREPVLAQERSATSTDERFCPIVILIADDSVNPFGAYLGEVLRAEGLNCFRFASIASISSRDLAAFPLALLTEGATNQAQRTMLTEYVTTGGRLIGLRPDVGLATLFGVATPMNSHADVQPDDVMARVFGAPVGDDAPPGGYFMVNPTAGELVDMDDTLVQFHGAADFYQPEQGKTLAWLCDAQGQRLDHPALVHHRLGKGTAALFAFDPVRSVILTRQGNPLQSNQEHDDRDGIRAHDAFVGWMDLSRLATLHADLTMRLVSRMINLLMSDVMPVPRFWYFPGGARSMLIATGDSHSNPAFVVDDVLTDVERHGGRMSVYYTPPDVGRARRLARQMRWWAANLPLVGGKLENPYGFPSPSQVKAWRDRGHEFTIHPEVEEGIEPGFHEICDEFDRLGYGPITPTVRTHRVLWSGWVETARMQAEHGFHLNLDYYQVGPAFQDEEDRWVMGHFTGSGLPMKFVDEQGRIQDIYQQLTQLVDEQLFEVPWVKNMDLNADAAVDASRRMIENSVNGGYCALVAQFHTDPFFAGDPYASKARTWLNGTLGHAAQLDVPIWTAECWLQFTQTRHDAEMVDIEWDSATGRLRCSVIQPQKTDAPLSVMLPLHFGTAQLSTINGASAGENVRRLTGVDYVWFDLSDQANTNAIEAYYRVVG